MYHHLYPLYTHYIPIIIPIIYPLLYPLLYPLYTHYILIILAICPMTYAAVPNRPVVRRQARTGPSGAWGAELRSALRMLKIQLYSIINIVAIVIWRRIYVVSIRDMIKNYSYHSHCFFFCSIAWIWFRLPCRCCVATFSCFARIIKNSCPCHFPRFCFHMLHFGSAWTARQKWKQSRFGWSTSLGERWGKKKEREREREHAHPPIANMFACLMLGRWIW